MKKILSIVAIGALFTSYGFGASGDFIVKGKILESAVVGLGSTSITLTSGQHNVVGYTMANFNTEIPLGNAITPLLDEVVHLQTNNKSTKVQMSLVFTTMANTASGLEGNTIDLQCEYDKGTTGTYAEKTTGTAFDLTASSATTTTDNSVGKLKISAKNASATQVAGNYQGTVVATISSL